MLEPFGEFFGLHVTNLAAPAPVVVNEEIGQPSGTPEHRPQLAFQVGDMVKAADAEFVNDVGLLLSGVLT